jgi:hypothetical protein
VAESKKTASKNTDYQKEIENSVKMFDVSHPNTSRPSPTSRPVIVRHKGGTATDPMVAKAEEEPKEPSEEPKTELKVAVPVTKHRKVIQPDSSTPKQEVSEETETKEQTEPDIPEEPQKEDSEPEVPKEPETPEVPKSETDSGVPETQPNDAINELTKQVTDKKDKEKADQAQTAYYAELQKSIDAKEFVLPIKTAEQKQHMRLVIGLFVLFLMAVALVYFFGVENGYINSLLNQS